MTKGDEVASHILQRRGYLVVGIDPLTEFPKRGHVFMEFAGMQLSQPIVVTEETDRADWIEQMKCAIDPFKADLTVPRQHSTPSKAKFFKAVTD